LFYANPYGEVYTQAEGKLEWVGREYSLRPSAFNLEALQNQAVLCAQNWRQIGNILFQEEVDTTQLTKKINLPYYFYEKDKKIKINKQTITLTNKPTIIDVDYVALQYQLAYFFHLHNPSDNTDQLLYHDSRSHKNEPDHYTCNSLKEFKIKLESSMHANTSCVITVSRETVPSIFTYIRELKDCATTLQHQSYTEDNPLTTFNLPEINDTEYLLRSREECYIQPKSLFDKILYGIIASNAENENLSSVILPACMTLAGCLNGCKAIALIGYDLWLGQLSKRALFDNSVVTIASVGVRHHRDKRWLDGCDRLKDDCLGSLRF
jgi:hypothetical protein